MMKKIIYLSILFFALASCGEKSVKESEVLFRAGDKPGISEEKRKASLKIATLNWSPYVIEHSKNKGFTYDIVKESFAASGKKTQIDIMPWAQVLRTVEMGDYDLAFPAYYSEERDKKYILSKEFAFSRLVLLTLESNQFKYNSLEDLRNMEIGTVRGYVNQKDFDKASYIKKVAVDSDSQNMEKLLYGNISIIVIDESFAMQEISAKKLYKNKFKVIGVLEKKPLHVIFHKTEENKLLLNSFAKGLEKIKSNGVYSEIMKKYGANQ